MYLHRLSPLPSHGRDLSPVGDEAQTDQGPRVLPQRPVDPQTLKVKAIIDWEYAGFFPAQFEGMYFRRPGPSVALGGEVRR